MQQLVDGVGATGSPRLRPAASPAVPATDLLRVSVLMDAIAINFDAGRAVPAVIPGEDHRAAVRPATSQASAEMALRAAAQQPPSALPPTGWG